MHNFLNALVGGKAGPGKGIGAREYKIGDRRVVEERHLSEGGFSFVVQVRDPEDGESYALKKILCQDEESFAFAQREVEILENLPAHKNIVGYFGHAVIRRGAKGRNTREVLILLELCPGGHLLDFLDRHKGVLPEAQLLKAFLDIAEAIFCLHSHSPAIQHRDLKLENVLLGKDGFWKVVDFGSWSNEAVDLASVTTKQLSIISEEFERHTTMMYRPPEMVDVHLRFPVTCAVDIWMLGCILYVLMYNRHPFQDAAAFAIRSANYSIPERKPALPGTFVDLLIWLLAQDPRHRPSARKLVTTLWQWGDLDSLELPAVLAQRRQQILQSTYGQSPAFQPSARENGAVTAKVTLAAKKVRKPQPKQLHTAPDVGIAAVASPWVAFEDSLPDIEHQSMGVVTSSHVLTPPAELAPDDWAFDGFQSAGFQKSAIDSSSVTPKATEAIDEHAELPETDTLPESTEVTDEHVKSPALSNTLWKATETVDEHIDSPTLSDTLPKVVDEHVESSAKSDTLAKSTEVLEESGESAALSNTFPKATESADEHVESLASSLPRTTETVDDHVELSASTVDGEEEF